jgi:predicted phosphoribosyltransferase
MKFQDRTEAGQRLAAKLADYTHRSDVVVLALPRGGVPVAFEVAKALDAPLDIFLVRKLGVPGHEELAMGAIATGEVRVLNEDVVQYLRIPEQVIDAVAREEQQELKRRERAYRGDRPKLDVRGRTVILVDDGLATGSTMRAAAMALREQQPARIIVAVPVSSPSSCNEFKALVDDCICVVTPEPFYAVGLWYEDFRQTTDEEVRRLLAQAEASSSPTDMGNKKTGDVHPLTLHKSNGDSSRCGI